MRVTLRMVIGFLTLTVLAYSHLRRDTLATVMTDVGLMEVSERP